MLNHLRLLRPYQWYKNILIFLPIVFAAKILDIHAVWLTVLGFVSLCLVASSNYVMNDIIDRERDRLHPEKKNRPLASGMVSIPAAVLLFAIVLTFGLLLGFFLSAAFGAILCIFFLLTLFYSVWWKEEPFLDVIMISINFMLRSVIGAFVITVGFAPYLKVSSWLVLGTFFAALFLSIGKREADLRFLGSDAASHKKVLSYYDVNLTEGMRYISTALLIMAYALYSFYSQYHLLLFSVPVVMYAIFRYSKLIADGSVIARHPHHVFEDGRMVFSMVLWGFIAFISIYWWQA